VTGPGSALGQLAFCTSNLTLDPTGTTPDLLNGVISSLTSPTGLPSSSAGFCASFTGFDLPDFSGSTDTHAVLGVATGTTALWLCSDTGLPAGRSYFTTNAYATSAIPLTYLNWMIRAVVVGTPGSFTINDQVTAHVGDSDPLRFTFWGTAGTS